MDGKGIGAAGSRPAAGSGPRPARMAGQAGRGPGALNPRPNMQYIQGRFEEHARNFVASKHNVEARLRLVTNFRESIEIAHTSEYENFLKCLFPVFANALREGAPMYMECDEQKIRNVLLEILNRLPNNEVLRPYVHELLRLVMEILSIDNQENALICLRIIFDVHKNFSPNLENEVQAFINFFIDLYKTLPSTVQLVFQRQPNRTAIASDGTQVKVLCKSVESFKVLTECPLIVMLLFQLYPHYVDSNIHHLIPLMMRALNIQPPTNLTQQHSQLYSDFIAAQVKTLSFLTYVLRGFADRMHPHQDNLSKCVIQLLLNCPTSSINSRKELLVATRHILATNFRKGFFKKIHMMLKEEVLIGQGRAHEIVRPLAYSTLADLVHHVRGDLSIEQLSKVIYIFSRNIHDHTLPLSIQTASVRLILTLVDHIYRTSDAQDRGRTLLVRILHALVNKFDTLKDYIPKLIELVNQKKKRVQAQGHTWTLAYTPRTEKEFPEDSVREVKQLMFTMVFGLKTVVWCISNFRSHSNSKHNMNRSRPMVLDEEECRIVARFLQHGLECFKIYTLPGFTRGRSHQIEKDVLEHFASVFTVLDQRSFRDVFSVQIETLFEQIVANKRLSMHMLIIPQHFLSSSNVSKAFADILLSFLTKKMKDMAKPSSESSVSFTLLNLFRIVFGSVTLFEENETVLKPYLNKIVSTAMKLINEVKHPNNYLSLLRFLFRSIGGGKFELLYKEFLPLLPRLLQGLMKIQARGPQSIREISIELCLTVPARLSSLLQFIPLLVKAVVLALKAKDEQVIKLGLRTLEFWVDNLNPEYLYPHMCTVLSDLMRALCALLRPHPSPFGMTALSVLGKLGGRNRRFLIEAFDVNNEVSAEHGLLVAMTFYPKHSFQLPLDKLIEFAGDILCRATPSRVSAEEDKDAKKQAYLFLRNCLMVMIDRSVHVTKPQFVNALKETVKENDKDSKSNAADVEGIQPCSSAQNREEAAVVRIRSFNSIKEHVFQQLCKHVIVASSLESLRDDPNVQSKKFLESIAQHFALLFIFSKNGKEVTESLLDAKVFLDAIVEVMCNENRGWFEAARATLDMLLNLFVQILGQDKAGKLPVLSDLLSKLSHCCYKDRWEPRHAGCMGLTALCDKMSPAWVQANQGELIRALMFTFRDSQSEYAAMTAAQANASLDRVVRISCQQCTTRVKDKKPVEAKKPVKVTAPVAMKGVTATMQPAPTAGAAAAAAAAATKSTTTIVAPTSAAAPANAPTAFAPSTKAVGAPVPVPATAPAPAPASAPAAAAAPAPATAATAPTLATAPAGMPAKPANTPAVATAAAAARPNGAAVQAVPGQKMTTDGKRIPIAVGAVPNQAQPSPAMGQAAAAAAGAFPTQLSGAMAGRVAGVVTGATHMQVAAAKGAVPMQVAAKGAVPRQVMAPGARPIQPGAVAQAPSVTMAGAVLAPRPVPGKATAGAVQGKPPAAVPVQAQAKPTSAVPVQARMGAAPMHVEGKAPAAAAKAPPPAVDKMSVTRSLVTILAPELISGIFAVRTCAHRLLGLVSELSGTTVANILSPYRTRLLAPVLQQSLHAVPMSIRIGYICAATYCLSLRPPICTVADLLYLLHDAIADVTEDNGQNYGGSIAGRAGRVQLLNRLQVEDIKLMSAALASDDIRKKQNAAGYQDVKNEYQDLKNKLIRVFFRSLLSRTPEIVEVAKLGLKKVIEREKLPKELLQQCMRPILLNLADIRKLCMPLLDGLSRLLELLSNCFNATLGEKLLDHLRKFADPDQLGNMRYDALTEKGGSGKMKSEDEVQVAASIIGLFHLLPPDSDSFLDKLVQITLKLESILPALNFYGGYGTGSSSPYREPLIKFLIVEPRKTVSYFFRNLSNRERKLSQMFQAIMRHDACDKIRKVVMDSPDELIRCTFEYKSAPEPTRTELVIQGIKIVHILSSKNPKWLSNCKKVVNCLLQVWESPGRRKRLKEENESKIGHIHESKLIVECLIHYCRVHRTEVTILWKMLDIFLHRTLVDFTFLAEFYEKEVAQSWTADEKKAITAGLLKFFAQQTQSQEQQQRNEQLKVKALQLIIIPILEHTFKSAKEGAAKQLQPKQPKQESKPEVKSDEKTGDEKKDSNEKTNQSTGSGDKMDVEPLIARKPEPNKTDEQKAAESKAATAKIRAVLGDDMVTTLIKELVGGQQAVHYREDLRVQLLRLTTLLIEHLHSQLTPYRKELIKFAWNHLKSDNSASKQWAYVNVCRFIDVYETPAKIVLQVYVALLRTYQPEARKLVSKALDIITPALPKRLALGKHKHPTWIKWTKKIIVEEGHLVPQLIHIWNLIIRHPDLFYGSRTQFVPQMVNSLNRLGLPQNRPPENRKLALDLADLIIRWDQRCLQEHKEAKEKAKADAIKAKREKAEKEKAEREKAEKEKVKTENPEGASDKTSKMDVEEKPGEKVEEKPDEQAAKRRKLEEGKEEKGVPNQPAAQDKNALAKNDELTKEKNGKNEKNLLAVKVKTEKIDKNQLALKDKNQVAHKDSKQPSVRERKANSQTKETPFRPNRVMVELIITFLIRLGLMTCEVHETRFLSIRCLKLLEQAMKVWKGGELKFLYIQKILASPQNQTDPSVLLTCTLEILNILLTHQPKEFVVKHIAEIQDVLKKCYHLPNHTIRKGLCGVVSKIVSGHPGFAPRNGLMQSGLAMRISGHNAPNPEIAKFYSHLRETIDSGLRQIHLDSKGMRSVEKISIHTTVALVSEISKVCTNYMDSTLSTNPSASSAVSTSFGHLIKATLKLAKDHVQNPMLNMIRGRDAAATQREQQKAAQILDTLLKALTLIRNRAHAVAEHKKPYFQTLGLLIEKSNNAKLLRHIAETIRSWMSNKSRTVPNFTHKERVTFILKMTRFEKLKNKDLSKVYLGMVLELFEAHRYVQKPEWLTKLQEPFMLGLCCDDLTLKHRFRDIFHSHVPKTLYLRLNRILATEDWEPLKGQFWISQALDMILSIVVEGDALRSSSGHSVIPAVKLPSISADEKTMDVEEVKPGTVQGVNSKLMEILTNYMQFLNNYKDLTVQDILKPMRELIHYERKFASELWVVMMSKAWSRLNNADRANLSEPIIELMAQDWHIDQQYKDPNPVQVLLEGFSRCNPIPPIRPELLQHLAQTYKCWHLVARILEDRVLKHGTSANTLNDLDNLKDDWDDAFDPDYNTASNDSLQNIYRMLKEDDVMYGLLGRRVKSGFSKSALALEQLGQWTRAQDQFFGALKKIQFQRRFHVHDFEESFDSKKPKILPKKPIKTVKIKGFKNVKVPQRKPKKSNPKSLKVPIGRKIQKQKTKHSRVRRSGTDGKLDEDDPNSDESLSQIGEAEIAMWQSEWVKCARHLNQWEVLSDFSKTIVHPEMQLECAWRQSEWDKMKEIFGTDSPPVPPPSSTSSGDPSAEEKNLLRNYNAKTMLYYTYMILHDRKSHEDQKLEHLLSQSVQKALLEWQTLPSFVSNTHTGLLHRFHILVELKESIAIIHELNQYRRQNQVPNLKTFITTWRERLPNKWEEIPIWSEVTTWRNQMFNLITNTFPSINDMQHAAYSNMHDTPWTFIKFAQIARKQHLSTVCLTSLAKLYRYPSMEPKDAFSKLREHIKCCLQSPMEIRAALNIISKTNLDYFTTEQKAEIFRLKGEALQHLGYGDESNTAFSAAISICDTYGKAWLSWAIFCDRVFTLKQDLQWAKHAVVCYLQAIRHKKNRARLLIARILWLLSYDRDNGPVNMAFTRYTEHLPSWIWLLWIPQLLSSLARPEGLAVKNILCKIARKYPQSLYYTVRAYLIEKREIRNSVNVSRQRSASRSQAAQNILAQAASVPQPSLTTTETKKWASININSGSTKLQQAIQHIQRVQTLRKQRGQQNTQEYREFDQLIGYFTRLLQLRQAASFANASASGGASQGDAKGIVGVAAKSGATAVGAIRAKQDPSKVQQTNANLALQAKTTQQHAAAVQQLQAQLHAHRQLQTQMGMKTTPQQQAQLQAAQQRHLQAIAKAKQAVAAAAAAAAAAKSAASTSAGSSTSSATATGDSKSSTSNAIKWVEEVVSVLRRSHPTLMTEVEKMLDEFSRRFKPEPEEELLGAVHALILKCFKQQLSRNDQVPQVLQMTIKRVCRKFFTPDPRSGNKKHLAFVKKYKQSFESDFFPEGSQFPLTLGLLLKKLKRWKAHLQYKVGERSQIHLRLEKLSPYLIRFQSYDIEIPGQYLTDREPNVDQNIVLHRFDPNVKVHHTHGFSHRRICMRGNDGKRYSFLVQYSISHITRSDERMMQVYVLFNRMIAKYKGTRTRNLVFHVPLVVPLTHRLRLMQTNEAHISLEEVYEQSCAVRKIDPDSPLLTYREMMHQSGSREQDTKARIQAYESICETVVPEYILSRYVDRIVRASDQYWAFKKEFAAQIALSGFLSYIMNIGDRSLHKLSFSKKSGRIINSEFYPAYNQYCIIDCQESVPFRLTRNITSFLTPLMVDGIVASVLTVANSCLLRNQDVIRNYLCLFIRDDLLSWNSTKMSMPDDRGQRQLETQLRDKIRNNVGLIIKRLHMLMPPQQTDNKVPPVAMNYKVLQLIKDATSKKRLAMMSSTWQPWF